MRAYSSNQKMCNFLLESLDMERNAQGLLEFKDYLPVAPSRPVGKLYDVKVEATLATADQIKRLTATGALRPPTVQGKSSAPASKATTRGTSAASLTAGGGTVPASTVPVPTPAASTATSPDKSLDGYDVEYSDTGEVLLVEKSDNTPCT